MVDGWVANAFSLSSTMSLWQVQACTAAVLGVKVCGFPERFNMYADDYAGRAIEAPVIRQLFSSSPRDPRYHMLSYISQKFTQDQPTHVNEPRAALFLNRFSRTLAIMYATNGLADLLGIHASQLIGKSFYFCIQENCLREAVKCLESAKANDSIAYLRFWFRDPTQDNNIDPERDEPMNDGHTSADSDDDGGVHLSELMEQDGTEEAVHSGSSNSMRSSAEPPRTNVSSSTQSNSRSPSGNSTDLDGNANDALFDQPAGFQSSTSSISTPDEAQSQRSSDQSQIELEAVVSCTSDGLVVVLRAARPLVPQVSLTSSAPVKHPYANGFFASPWASSPIIPDTQSRSGSVPGSVQPARFPVHPPAAQANTPAMMGPANEDFMNSIRETVVFAWSLIGINGSLVKHSRGTPSGESQPPNGLPVWEYQSDAGPEMPLAQQHIPNGYRYNPDDGSPIYDPMSIDTGHSNGHSNGVMKEQAPQGAGLGPHDWSDRALNGRQAPVQHRPEVGSSLKHAVSVNDVPTKIPTAAFNPAGQVANGQLSVQNVGNPGDTPTTILPQNQVPAYSNGHQDEDEQKEYDPFAPSNYPVTAPAGTVNGSTLQQSQSAIYNKGWNVPTSTPSQEQTVNGYSRWT